MTTEVKLRKEGLYIELSTRKFKRPKKNVGVYSMPDVPLGSTSFLRLSLVESLGTTRYSILVQAAAPLPTAKAKGLSYLQYFSYQGDDAPDDPWGGCNVIPVDIDPPSNYVLGEPFWLAFIEEAMSESTYVFRIKRVIESNTSYLPEASIYVPEDPMYYSLEAMFDDDVLSAFEKSGINGFIYWLDDLLENFKNDKDLALEWDVSITEYSDAIGALMSFLTALEPSIYDKTVDTPLGDGGGQVLLGLCMAVIDARYDFHKRVKEAEDAALEMMMSDDAISPGEKRIIKAEVDRILSMQASLVEQAGNFGVSASSLNSVVDSLLRFLANAETGIGEHWDGTTKDWRDYTVTSYLVPGRGATLWYWITRCRSAIAELERAIAAAIKAAIYEQQRWTEENIATYTQYLKDQMKTTPKVVTSLPNLPNDNYPVGSMVLLINKWGGYDAGIYERVGNAWVKSPLDGTALAAGTITGGQIKAGSLTADLFAANFALIGQSIRSGNYQAPQQIGGVSALPSLPNANYPVGWLINLMGQWGGYVPGLYVNNDNVWELSNLKPGIDVKYTLPLGWRIDGTPYDTRLLDGTPASVQAEFGGNVNIGGNLAATIGKAKVATYDTIGYAELPGGMLLQWVVTPNVASMSEVSAYWLKPFPNNCFGVSVTTQIGGTSSTIQDGFYLVAKYLDRCRIWRRVAGASDIAVYAHILAFGN